MVSDMIDIYLTEMSLKELLEGKEIYEEDDIIIHPPKTNELGIMVNTQHET